MQVNKQLLKPSQTWLEKAAVFKALFLKATSAEKTLMHAVRIVLHCGDGEKFFGCSKISRYAFEYKVDSGLIDLVLFHADGGVSIIEAKAQYEARNIAAGIGQLYLYRTGINRKLSGSNSPTYINKILLVPADLCNVELMHEVCAEAGVGLVVCAEIREMRAIQNLLIQKGLQCGA